MATFNWELQGATATAISESDILQFAGGTFDSKITVDDYNDSTHVKTSASADKSADHTPNNVKFISDDGGTAGVSEGDWGDGTEDLDDITEAEATLKVVFSHDSSVTTSDAEFYSYDGTTPATPLPNVDFVAAEVGDTAWTHAEGSGNALSLTSGAAATAHAFYIAASCSPESVGLKEGKVRLELTYA